MVRHYDGNNKVGGHVGASNTITLELLKNWLQTQPTGLDGGTNAYGDIVTQEEKNIRTGVNKTARAEMLVESALKQYLSEYKPTNTQAIVLNTLIASVNNTLGKNSNAALG